MLKNLGEKIRALRKQKGLTLVEIAEKTGIAQATLSRIETGSMIGTVESHEKITEILGVTLSELYAGVDSRAGQTAHLKKEAERKTVHHNKGIQVELLTQEASHKKITPLLITLQPESHSSPEQYDRGVEKFFYILEGEVRAKIDKDDYQLKTGETLYFDASLSHQLFNEKNKAVRILTAVSPSKI
jgi:transcriptional regulator with XRE-family HTH domain